MADEDRTPDERRPLGERDKKDRAKPFGSNPPRRIYGNEGDSGPSPYAPYSSSRSRRKATEPTPEPSADPLSEPNPDPAFEPELEPEPSDWDIITDEHYTGVIPIEDEPLPDLPAEEDEPPAADEPLIQEESVDAPVLIRARDRRGKVAADKSILKRRERPETDFESYLHPASGQGESAQLVIRFGVLLRSLGTMFFTAAVIATIFTWWTPVEFLPAESSLQLSIARATQAVQAAGPIAQAIPPTPLPPTAVPAVNNIGIVSGHRGLFPDTGLPDPGAVCEDGLTEREVNEAVALRVQTLLEAEGYTVDLMEEFDPRLPGYHALAMVSIHADSCEYYNDLATGFKVASFEASTTPEEDQRLVNCLIEHYSTTTGLSFHPSITYDMTRYHNFAEIGPETPGVIIEIGFMYLDRPLLTGQPDLVAQGVADGILCFLREEPVDPANTATPAS